MRTPLFFALKLIFICFFSNIIDAQLDSQKIDLYDIFDNIIGQEASGLYNGIQYNNEFIILDEKHQFLDTSDFLEGSVHYNDQDYYNIYIKYDLFYDQIIIRPQNSSGSLAFKLIKPLVDGFSVNEKTFINVKAINQKTNEPLGYCEVLSETGLFILYKKSIKKASKKAKNDKVFYEFNLSYSYHLKYKNVYSLVTTRSELISVFPNHKSIIKEYYKGYRQLLKSDPDTFIKLLLTRLNKLEKLKTT